MKSLFWIPLFLLVLATNTQLSAQASKVNIGPRNAWVDEVGFDKGAEPAVGQKGSYYYLLMDEQENVLLQESFAHYTYRILSNEGVQQMSDLRFEFDPSYEKLIVHTIRIHRGGVVIDKLPKEIPTIRREESIDRFLYDGTLTADINLSDVRVGDIVEYALTRKGYNPIYEGYITRRFYLNHSYGFEKGYQKIITREATQFSFKKANTTLEPDIKKQGSTISYTWNTSRVPPLVTDNHEPDWFNPYAYVSLTNFKNWGELVDWASKNYIVSNADRQAVLNEIAPMFKATSKEKYADQAIRFVQDEVRYLGFESGLNSHKPHAPLQVFNQRFGDCKDKSFLLVTMLRAKDIEAYPVLINTSSRDKLSEFLPSNAFDHCVVQLMLNGNIIYIDPTINDQGGDERTRYFPPYGKGLVLKPGVTELVDIPKPVSPTTSETQIFKIDSIGGPATMTVETRYTGAQADNQRSYFSRNNLEATQKSYLTFYGNSYPSIEKLDDLKIEDHRDSNIFVVTEKYKIPGLWSKSTANENVVYCEFRAQSMEDYFSVSKSSSRTAPYSVTYPLEFHHQIIVDTPEEWEVKEEDELIENSHYRYRYEVKYDARRLSISTQYATKESSIPENDFRKFVEDHQKMMGNLSYQITYDQSTVKAQSNEWPGVILSVLSIGLGVWLVLWLYKAYDPQPHYPSTWAQPIGGWLILVGIGIVVTPISLLYSFYNDPSLLNGQGWLSMWYARNYGLFIFIALEHIYNLVYMIFSLLVVLLFFRRRSSLPRLASILYGVGCLVMILDTIIARQIDPSADVDSSEITRRIIGAAIWIPYFHKSNRVKKTFVYTHHNQEDESELVAQPVVADAAPLN